MKINSISIRRNYHLSNDDSYAKGEWSISADIDENDDAQECYSLLADELDLAFKTRYPNVRNYLNFDEVRQVNPNMDWAYDYNNPTEPATVNDGKHTTTKYPDGSFDVVENKTGFLGTIIPTEKTQKGTIEEQIEACTKLSELLEWRLLADSTKSLKPIYEKRYFELESISKLQTT